MRASLHALADGQVPSDIPTQNTIRKLIVASDAPFKATIETRTSKQQAQDVGALVIERLRRRGVLKSLPSPTARHLLYSLCYEHSRVENFNGVISLMVRKEAKEIAAAEGLSERSAYEPLRYLIDDAEIVRRIRSGGNNGDHYEVIIPPPDPAEKQESEREVEEANLSDARAASDTAAQLARARSDESAPSDRFEERKPFTEPKLARAALDESALSDRFKNANAGFCTDNPLASNAARAPDSTYSCTLTLTSTGEEKGAGENATAGGVEWLLPWLLSMPDMKPHVARKLAGNSLITPRIAQAARYELEHSAASRKPNFKPAGLIYLILSNPLKEISRKSWEAVEQSVPKQSQPASFAPTALENLLPGLVGVATPPPAPTVPPAQTPATIAARPISDEARATQLQETIEQHELAALHRELIRTAPNDFMRISIAKANPRTSPVIHALIMERLKGAAV